MSTPPRYEAAFTDPRNDHPVVHSLVNGELLLDVKIAPIIDFLLSNGVKTLFSCQGDPFTKVLPPTYESVFLSRKYAGYISCLDSENLFKATARMCYEDIEELGKLLGY